MRKSICGIALIALLSACSTTREYSPVINEKIVEPVDKVRSETNRLIRFNRDIITPPLDLTKYKQVKFNIVEIDGENFVVLTYEDYTLLMELLKVVEGRLIEQEVFIDEVMDFYDKQIE